MISVGIDVAKDKHDCFILRDDGVVMEDVFTIANDLDGFRELMKRIHSSAAQGEAIKVGLEATGHYSYNILGFLQQNDMEIYVLNPLQTSRYRKSQSLRMTKTDRVDARNIASMLLSGMDLTPYTDSKYSNEELKSLTRYRFDKVKERAMAKQSVSRLVCILFPELEKLFSSVHMTAVYALLEAYPGARQVADADVKALLAVLSAASHGHCERSTALAVQAAARSSIGSNMPAKSLELRHTIHLIRELNAEIREIEHAIEKIVKRIQSPILTIPGVGSQMGAIILAEVGEFSRFDSADKLLAYAGLSPTTYQSGKMENRNSRMEKRGSRYLRYAIYNATKYACIWDPSFRAYLEKKRAEGKHYNVAISHAAKKLVRLIYALENSGEVYQAAA